MCVCVCSLYVCFVLLASLSYPGQVLYLCVRGDVSDAFLLSVLHIPQVEHTGNYVQQLLLTEGEKMNGQEEVEGRT